MVRTRVRIRNGDTLRDLRINLGKTRLEIARASNIPKVSICRFETGAREYVTQGTADSLARALRVKRDVIVEVVG